MADATSIQVAREAVAPLRLLAEQAFARTAGAPLIPGNDIRLLRDAAENYPAWLDAIRSARKTIHFETYILHADKVGYEFAELLEAKAREGVSVQLIYDWFGARGAASFLFWRRLRKAGVEVRCFNPPRLDDPIESLRRDHRKCIVVDGRIGFVSGLCVGQSWLGDPPRSIPPWRDTGVKIEGPAVLDLDRAFGRMWNSLASNLAEAETSSESHVAPAGDVSLRIVASEPSMAGLYRLDLLVTALARRSMWLTDAYFLGTPSYVQSLRAAAFDGVDVRLLLPRTSDVPMVRALSRVGYRTLLESGVRIFEWNGSMLHAKTAVADGRWSRVGSTNLNMASWTSNYELDVVVEDESFAEAMREMYLDDLEHSTEIILNESTKVRPRERRKREDLSPGSARGSAGRAATGVVALGNTLGAAVTTPRLLGPAEAPIMIMMAMVSLLVVGLAIFLPLIVSILVAIVCGWVSAILFIKAFRLRFSGRKEAR
ncbi:MAG TPA: phospholipase D-like domain-containing protein [Candidatus Acidoferrales bacterium]|nr:phospholipase D-like domain-containing protein [Candidatus Acidoferrales bacterium]